MDNVRRFIGPVRVRSALLSMVVVLVALTLGSVLTLNLYEGQLLDNLDATVEQQVADRVRLLDNGGSPDSMTSAFGGEAFVWIVARDGELVARGGSILPLENPVPEVIGQTTTVELLVEERKPDEVEVERYEYRLVSGASTTGQVVVAATGLEQTTDAVAELGRLFVIAIPVLTALVGAVAWIAAGRALRPVAAIRAQAESISGTTLADRVPVLETHDEVQDLAETVNAMLDRIERHDLAIRQFSSDASHELKSPIANIKAMVETRTSADATWPEVQRRLAGETNRLGDLVDNLLFLATHQDRRVGDRTNQVQLDELLFGEASMVSATSPIRVDLSRVEPVSMGGSTSDLSRLLRNLIDNAVRHASSGIALGLVADSTTVTITIADDGPGVPIEDRERIFERFTRLDEARARDQGGTGLGLNIASQVVEAHGGTIEVADSELGGALFTVAFPV